MANKQFFAKHAKSSAALVSLGIHAVFLVVALSFVAVTVIMKEEKAFEAKPVSRPKMQLKKLQVPVNIKKKALQPKLRKRIVVKPKMDQNMPDIKMPEITGVKGGLGGGVAGGIGGAGGVGFSMPEIEIFGVKGKGEKIFIILDATGHMMVDEMGGIPAYTIIKAELVRILEGLNPTILFNIAVYGGGDYTLFPSLVPASAANVDKVQQWLAPLNAVKKGMGDKDYGAKTLGEGGFQITGDNRIDPLKGNVEWWARPAMRAMEQQADAVFLLTCSWGTLSYGLEVGTKKAWSEAKMARWRTYVEKARAKHAEENAERAKRGEPPRVIVGGDRGRVSVYFPDEPHPPDNTRLMRYYNYTVEEIIEALANMRMKHKPQAVATTSGLGRKKKKKNDYTLNVINFVREDSNSAGRNENLYQLAHKTGGDYRKIKGMKAIESYVSSGEE